jgi:NADH:flavin oxidoreductases, Old Yellow Enzyme family
MKIFEPINIKAVQFQNRVVMAPMVPFGMPQLPTGAMSDAVLRHYFDRAANGMGLMILQALSVTSKGPHDGGVGVYTDEHMGYLHTIAAACHEQGTKVFAQLAYPSIGHHNGDSVNLLTAAELAKITGEFVHAALRCKEAGCDGVELHGAHGFFLNMFASPLANQRTDGYGGGLEERLRLAGDIINGIRPFLNDHFILSYRMGWNDDLDMDIQTARSLEALGVELLHVSSGIPANRYMVVTNDFPYNSIVFTGTEIKKHVKVPVTVVNDIRTLSRGNALLENGLCDFVAYGKPFLADPLFYANSLLNHDHQPCFRCKTCRWFTNGDSCPAVKRSKRLGSQENSDD